MSRKSLYRRLGSAVTTLALMAALAPPGAAQMPQLKRPQEDTPEKPAETKKPKKQVKGPRAVGLLQLTSSGKATLLPIAIQVDGKFYDASAYKADPVPMALESGTVYEVEQAGSSQGLFTISGALHSKTPSAHPWMGAGAFLANGTEAAKTTRKAEDVPVGLNVSDNDAPPRLSRPGASKPSESSKSAPASGGAAGSPDKAGTSTPPASTQPADKPASPQTSAQDSTKRDPAKQDAAKQDATKQDAAKQDPAKQDSAKPAAPSTSDNAADKEKASDKSDKPSPAGEKPAAASPASPTAASDAAGKKSPEQPSETYYRPTLRRAKPTERAPVEDELSPKPSKAAAPGDATAPPTGALQLLPAVSDAGGPAPRTYKFFWKTGEEEERRNQMLALAADEIQAYTKALAKNSIPAKPVSAKPVAPHKSAAKSVQPVFEHTQFQAFDVWGNNQPVMILTTDAHFPPSPSDTTAPENYSITLVARTDIYGTLRKVHSGVTDRFHLDVTPRLELIDAVDADGDGRGELLFRETSDAGNGYIIYRPTADKLWKMFDSLQ